MTLLEEIATLLDELGLGPYRPTSADGTIFLTALPDSPDIATAVARYGGGEADSLLPYDEIGLQIRCRGTKSDASTAEGNAQLIYDALHGLGRRTLPGGTWLQLAVGTQGGPVYIGRDANARHEWVVNLRVEVMRPTVNRPAPA